VSYGSQKWAHWRPDDGELLRVSLGRDGLPCMHLDDDQALEVTLDELQRFHGVRHDVRHLRITRWPAGFAQYRPHHDAMIASVEQRLPAGLSLAGAGFHGIGIPACIRSGRRAGRSASDRMRES
jgi:protoporphyrinogen/coproporphyrinogen III oxidase